LKDHVYRLLRVARPMPGGRSLRQMIEIPEYRETEPGLQACLIKKRGDHE